MPKAEVSFLFFLSISLTYCILEVALFFSWSFFAAATLSTLLHVFLLIIYLSRVAFAKGRPAKDINHASIPANFIALSILTGILFVCINRYSGDDGFYLAKAVFYSENPQALIDLSNPWIAGLPDGSGFIRFQFYEAYQAIWAWLLGLKVLTVSHLLFPFMVGCLCFGAIYLLLGAFNFDSSSRLLGAVLLILLVMLFGDTPRSFGVYSLARSHQGKSVLMFLGFTHGATFCFAFSNLIAFTKVQLNNCSVDIIFCDEHYCFCFIPFLSGLLFVAFLALGGYFH